MKYVIEKNDSNLKLIYYNVNMTGMDVTPKNGVKDLKIKAEKILLVDPELRENYIKERVNRKIDQVIKFMLRILNDDDTLNFIKDHCLLIYLHMPYERFIEECRNSCATENTKNLDDILFKDSGRRGSHRL